MTLTGIYGPSPIASAREQAETYEATGGAELGTLLGAPIIVLTSRGARTGAIRKNPLIRIEHDGEYAVVASNGGSTAHPSWFHNLVAHPDVELQDDPGVRAHPGATVSSHQRRTIGVLGSGPVGRGFARLLEHAGYDVTLGTRRPTAPALAGLPARVRVSEFREAAQSDVIFLAVVHLASRELVTSLADELAGKILIDADNAWIPAHYQAAGLSATLTEGSWLAHLLPRTIVARAFSHIDAPYLVPRGLEEPGTWAVSYAVDDLHAAGIIEQLIRDMGYIPYPVGTLEQSGVLDFDGALSGQLLTPGEMRAALSA